MTSEVLKMYRERLVLDTSSLWKPLKNYVVEASTLELKVLFACLKYAFLKNEPTIPIIISFEL